MHARSTRIDSGWLAAKFSARLPPAACVLESDRSKAVSDSYKIYFSHVSQFCDHRYMGRLLMPLPRRRMGLSSDEERALSQGAKAGAFSRLPLPVLRADADVLRAHYVLVQMQEGVGATGDKRGRRRGRAGGLAAIAAITALRLLVGVGRSHSCLPQRGRVRGCSSPLALRARCQDRFF